MSGQTSEGSGCCGGGQITTKSDEQVRDLVKVRYGAIAREQTGCCGTTTNDYTTALGYEADALAGAPDEANLGLGCGNPHALASLRPGEVVVDLGSGGGLDALIAGQAVGPDGRVIGVDMTPDMLALARRNAVQAGLEGTVEFREGVIEALPITSDSVDVILSNCVINLSPDKRQAFSEAFRVLRAGGRLSVSDILLTRELPDVIKQNAEAYVGCIGGAVTKDEYFEAMEAAGFVEIEYTRQPAAELLAGSTSCVEDLVAGIEPDLLQQVAESVWSYKITAKKPAAS